MSEETKDEASLVDIDIIVPEPEIKLDNEPQLNIKLNRKQRRAFISAMRKRKKRGAAV